MGVTAPSRAATKTSTENINFSAWKLFHAAGVDPSRWRPQILRKKNHETPVTAKKLNAPFVDIPASFEVKLEQRWVYVIRELEAGGTDLLFEIFVENEGKLSVVKQISDGLLVDIEQRKLADAVRGFNVIRLHHTLHSAQVFYYFFASPVQLPKEQLIKLLEIGPKYLPRADLSQRDYLIDDGQILRIPVVEPLVVAKHLADRYRRELRNYINFGHVTEDHSPKEAAEKQQKLAWEYLYRLVYRHVVQSSSAMQLKAKKHFANFDKARQEIQDYVLELDRRRARLVRHTDKAASSLCHWLDSALFKDILEPAFEHHGLLHEYLRNLGEASESLEQSGPGRAYFARIVQTARREPTDLYRRFVLRTEEDQARASADDKERTFKTARLAAKEISALWKGLAPVIVKLEGTKGARLAARSLELVSEISSAFTFREKSTSVELALIRGIQHYAGGSDLKTIKLVEVDITEVGKLTSWSKNGIGHVVTGIDVLNVALALYKIQQGIKNHVPANELAGSALWALSFLGNTVNAVRAMFGAAEKSVQRIGAFLAVYEIVIGGLDLRKAARRNDYNAAVGYGFAMLGAAAAGFGLILSSFGLVGIGGPLAWIGAAVGALAYMFVMAVTDDELEQWLEHCAWGESSGQGEHRPRWATASFKDWDMEPGTQIAALLQLIQGFQVKRDFRFVHPAITPHGAPANSKVARNDIEIHPGTLTARSRLTVDWHAVYEVGAEDMERHVAEGETLTTYLHHDKDTHQSYYRFHCPFGRKSEADNSNLRHVYLSVDLIPDVSQDHHVPHSKKFDIFLRKSGSWESWDLVRSIDF